MGKASQMLCGLVAPLWLVGCMHAATMQAPDPAPAIAPSTAPPAPPAAASTDWHRVATAADRARISAYRKTWLAALDDARARGFADQIKQSGVLLDPDAALPNPHIPPGAYRCRVLKVGSQGAVAGWIAYPWFRCRIASEQDLFSLTKIDVSQRQIGLLFDDGPLRRIFLGTIMLGDETRAFDYGVDQQRNVAGVLERIGPTRWRLMMPEPAFESKMDVMELIPA